MSESTPRLIVITPDALGWALCEAAAGPWALWRDGQVKPLVNRSLLLRYGKLFLRLGMPRRQIQHWSWRFHSPVHTHYSTWEQPGASLPVLCAGLARLAQAWIIFHEPAVRPNPEAHDQANAPVWITWSELCARISPAGQGS